MLLRDQVVDVQRMYPEFTREWKAGLASWTGTVQPTDVSDKYTVKLLYRLGDRPKLRVLSPELRGRDGDYIEHTYPGNEPCIYYPAAREWTPADSLAKTILPWVSDWLYFYEIWRVTGQWLADGEHLKPGAKRDFPARSTRLRSAKRGAR